jgi:lipid-binding SYLF domain-containing protein
MKIKSCFTIFSVGLGLVLLQEGCGTLSRSSDMAGADAEANAALQQLYTESPVAADLGSKAKAILIFPDVLKGGFVFGGHHGNGVLQKQGRTVGYYNTTAVSYGLQAGVQKFGYALFLMNAAALAHLHDTGGWELGTGPSLVVVDKGMAKSLTTTTLQKDIYAFVFNQSGLMAGIGLQGSKITEIKP